MKKLASSAASFGQSLVFEVLNLEGPGGDTILAQGLW
jgi:hypothetical protein